MPKPKPEYIVNPFRILVDNREQMPYRFQNINADAKYNHLPIVIETVKTTLQTGDYSIEGFEDKFTIERKSKQDAYSSIVHDRERFVRELERMSEMEFAMLLIECQEDNLYLYVHEETSGNPKAVYRSLVKWPVQYGIHVRFSANRNRAMRDAFRTMQVWWSLVQESMKNVEGA